MHLDLFSKQWMIKLLIGFFVKFFVFLIFHEKGVNYLVSGPALGIQICGCRFLVAGEQAAATHSFALKILTDFLNILHKLLKIAIFLYVGCSDKAKMSSKTVATSLKNKKN